VLPLNAAALIKRGQRERFDAIVLQKGLDAALIAELELNLELPFILYYMLPQTDHIRSVRCIKCASFYLYI